MNKTRRELLKAVAVLPVAMRAANSFGQTSNDPIRRIAIEEAFVTQEIAENRPRFALENTGPLDAAGVISL